jgi:hypothetical protein
MMEYDQDMMETYDGSTESDEDRLLAPLGDSYDAVVISFLSLFLRHLNCPANIYLSDMHY